MLNKLVQQRPDYKVVSAWFLRIILSLKKLENSWMLACFKFILQNFGIKLFKFVNM